VRCLAYRPASSSSPASGRLVPRVGSAGSMGQRLSGAAATKVGDSARSRRGDEREAETIFGLLPFTLWA
jgi:hypothetical protein